MPHAENDETDIGPIEALLRESTTATHRAVNAIREAEKAKEDLRTDINSLTTSFDSTIQKSLALIDRLDESVYSGRIDNAQKRAKIEKEADAVIQQADSAICLHREYFAYDGTVDARDVLAQVIEYKYRTNVLEKKAKNRPESELHTAEKLETLAEILDDLTRCIDDFHFSEESVRRQAANIRHTVALMKNKLSEGVSSVVINAFKCP
ncbi:unnamed protein product [Nippostrongylus brasiliensis]|uniref:Translin n=1 Tax=Nippostrongylus brasiliensis TaxID=27835 RepID=A0A0N4YEJ3_NIPBR|nr:unnamed protein product [Nippostrongylus brasiliensis]